MKNFLLGCVVLALATAPVIAQEVVEQAEIIAPSVERIEINEDGTLTGKVYANVASEETPVDAKVTLAKDGVVLEAVQTENGSFSFANISPGSYMLIGSARGYSGAQSFEVGPYAGSGCSCNLGLQSTNNAVYQESPVYDAPVTAAAPCTSCGSAGISSPCGSCGGGGFSGGGFSGGGIGGGGFGGGGGRLLGGRLGGRRLLRAGLIGGVVAIAVDDDDDDDVSAAE